ncbi:MAG: cobalamin-binding protein [Elainella sp.]
MTMPLRIVSLIPSATEIVDCLGLAEFLVGRSHECDYPASVQALPICTEPKFNPDGSSRAIHARVTDLLQSALSVYRVKTEVLEQLQPTHILTQAQCEVCAVSLADVEQAVGTLTGCRPQILSLQPNRLAEVWADLERVAAAFQIDAAPVLDQLHQRVTACKAARPAGPTVVCIEWAEPLMAAGNWIPELVELAGGRCLLGQVGEHSPWLKWEDLLAADPDLLVLMPCGYDLDRTRQDAALLAQQDAWSQLKAVQHGRVYITDGNQYFNRPGPRLVDSLEILAEILWDAHPEQGNLGLTHYRGQGWERYAQPEPAEPLTSPI